MQATPRSCAPRPGSWTRRGSAFLFAPVTALPMASSALRQRLAAGEDCAEELPEAVRAVIRREHLYQT